MSKKLHGNSQSFMDYKLIHYAMFEELNSETAIELSDRVLETPDGNFPVHFFSLTETMKSMPFVVHNCGYFCVGDKYFTKRNNLENYEFIYTTDGCGLIEIDGKEYTCTAGSAIIIDCRKYHYLHTQPDYNWSYKHLHFTAANDLIPLVNKALTFIPKIESLEKYVDLISEQLIYNQLNAPYLINKYIFDIITEITTFELDSLNNKISNKMDIVAQHIQKNYDKDITINELSEIVYLSPFHFSRQFKLHFNETPYQYITRLRVNKAKILLLQNRSIDFIVESCGFGTPSNFYRRFKSFVGSTPNKFKKENS